MLIASLAFFNMASLTLRPKLEVAPYPQIGYEGQNGKSLTMTWISSTGGEFKLTYRQGGSWKPGSNTESSTVERKNMSSHVVHWSKMVDLKPGEPIEFRVEGEGTLATGSVGAPKAKGQPFTFAVFGDCGASTSAQAQISNQVYNKKPDMVAITGDIVYADGRASEYAKSFFPYYAGDKGSPVLNSSLCFAAPGNHDILNRNLDKVPDGLAYFSYWKLPLNGPLKDSGEKNSPILTGDKALQELFAQTRYPAFPVMSNYSFDYGDAHWTIIDANPYVNWNDPKVRGWLVDDLKGAKNKTWRFVALHQPPFHSSLKHAGENQVRTLAEVFEDGNVDIVFGGHVHNYQRSAPILVGKKRGASKAELDRDDWSTDLQFDGDRVSKTNGVLYIVEGAGGNYLYDSDLTDDKDKWKPWQTVYKGIFSFGYAEVKGRRVTFHQIDNLGKVIDKWVLTK